MRLLRGPLVAVFVAIAAATPARADAFGLSIATLDDVDGDGASDPLIGDPYDTEGEDERPGRIWVVSGATGHAVRTHRGNAAMDYFGDCVACVGDLDRDGVRDYAASAPFLVTDVPGVVRAYSGRTGGLLLEIETPWSKWGAMAIVDAGDVDRDGTHDLALGIPRQVGREGTGEALVVSGRTGARIRTIATGRTYGADVACVDDYDGDGVPELAVATRSGLWSSGAVDVFSGRDGVRLSTLPLKRMLGTGDFDGDGRPDVLAGDAGRCETVTAWSLVTGDAIQVWSTPRAVSFSVLEDLDGDGTNDLLVGTQVELVQPAFVRVLSGRTTAVLREHEIGCGLEVFCTTTWSGPGRRARRPSPASCGRTPDGRVTSSTS
jgi:hypothetical protein